MSSRSTTNQSVAPAVGELAGLADERCRHCQQGVATAAHDLKTPLAVVRGYIDLLASKKLGPLTPRQIAVLKEMEESAERLRRFTDEFLTFYGMQAGIQLQLEEQSLNDCIADLVKMWAPQFAKNTIALYWLPGEGLPNLPFDYHKVQHILTNLLDNASHFTPPGGSVWIRTENYFWERRTGSRVIEGADRRRNKVVTPNAVRISVSDTGPGIAPENFQEIFEEFRQLAHGQSRRGMGLGLAIAKRLTEMQKGKIWVESELGNGSKFSVVFPYRR